METRFARLVLIALVLLPSAARAQGDESFVGLWLGEARTDGGLGNWIEIRADGDAQYSFGALVEFKYVMDATSLRLTAPNALGGDRSLPPEQMRIEGDRAVREQSSPQSAPPHEQQSPAEQAMFDRMSTPLVMTRVGHALPGAPPIVGTWSYRHYTGATAYERYGADGSMVLMVPMQVTHGTFTTTATTIVIRFPQGPDTLVRTGDVLLSGSMEGKHATYRRAPR